MCTLIGPQVQYVSTSASSSRRQAMSPWQFLCESHKKLHWHKLISLVSVLPILLLLLPCGAGESCPIIWAAPQHLSSTSTKPLRTRRQIPPAPKGNRHHGVDGGGGRLNNHAELRAVGAGCGVIKFAAAKHAIGEKATLISKVPEAQTVRRAEVFAERRCDPQ